MPEPVSLPDLKLHLRVDTATEDALITSYGLAAREFCELLTDHVLVQRQIVEQRPAFGSGIQIYRRPLVSVASVSYKDGDEAVQAYTGFVLRSGAYPATIALASGASWPSLGESQSITITYTAGYADGTVPEPFIQAIKLLVGHWYAHRETVMVGAAVNEVPFAVKSLLGRFMPPGMA